MNNHSLLTYIQYIHVWIPIRSCVSFCAKCSHYDPWLAWGAVETAFTQELPQAKTKWAAFLFTAAKITCSPLSLLNHARYFYPNETGAGWARAPKYWRAHRNDKEKWLKGVFDEQLKWFFPDKSFNSVHKQTNLVSEKAAATFKGCLLAEWIKVLAKE